jgi:CBS domain-containing protein
LSARAAWRLESLGLAQVFDYVDGKADWMARGLPIEGKLAHRPRAATIARRDVPTCRLTDRLGEVQARLRPAGAEGCVVVNDVGVVLGLLPAEACEHAPQTPVEEVMVPGPATIRPDVPLEDAAAYVRQHGEDRVLVTTSEGRLVGLLYRDDADHRRGRS